MLLFKLTFLFFHVYPLVQDGEVCELRKIHGLGCSAVHCLGADKLLNVSVFSLLPLLKGLTAVVHLNFSFGVRHGTMLYLWLIFHFIIES